MACKRLVSTFLRASLVLTKLWRSALRRGSSSARSRMCCADSQLNLASISSIHAINRVSGLLSCKIVKGIHSTRRKDNNCRSHPIQDEFGALCRSQGNAFSRTRGVGHLFCLLCLANVDCIALLHQQPKLPHNLVCPSCLSFECQSMLICSATFRRSSRMRMRMRKKVCSDQSSHQVEIHRRCDGKSHPEEDVFLDVCHHCLFCSVHLSYHLHA